MYIVLHVCINIWCVKWDNITIVNCLIDMIDTYSQALHDPFAHGRGQVKSNTLTCTPRNNGCVPNQIAGKV